MWTWLAVTMFRFLMFIIYVVIYRCWLYCISIFVILFTSIPLSISLDWNGLLGLFIISDLSLWWTDFAFVFPFCRKSSSCTGNILLRNIMWLPKMVIFSIYSEFHMAEKTTQPQVCILTKLGHFTIVLYNSECASQQRTKFKACLRMWGGKQQFKLE